MRKRNSVKQLNKAPSHRKAMMRNMATSLFEHESITTTRARAKALQSYAEKLVTRAKGNLEADIKPEKSLLNKREIMKAIRDRKIIVKLFEDIAPRFKERNGGYTRIIHLTERMSDSAQMSIIELVDKKEKVRKTRAPKVEEAPAKRKPKKSADAPVADGEEVTPNKGGEQGDKQGKWWNKFKKKKGEDHGQS